MSSPARERSGGRRLGAYRRLVSGIQALALPLFVPQARREGVPDYSALPVPAAASGKKRIWFHAASVGELEVLWPVAEQAAGEGCELILTVFSASAAKAVARLADALRARGAGSVLWAGYCPWEGRWGEALERLRPQAFVTAKYEAWPELWASLEALGTPLALVNARERRSIEVARKACRWLRGGLPRVLMLPIGAGEATALEASFAGESSVSVEPVGDPRWDRALGRAGLSGGADPGGAGVASGSASNARVRELVSRAEDCGALRPWFALGSAWPEDLEILRDGLQGFRGTLWVVPHSTDETTLRAIEATLSSLGRRARRTKDLDAADGDAAGGGDRESARGEGGASVATFLVNEHGILSELYGSCDMAYVGGGFRKAGLHSVIEPAVHGIPVLAGPSKSETMSETSLLRDTGQLALARDSSDAANWIEREAARASAERSERRANWAREATGRAGASRRAWQRILSLLKADG